MLSTISLESSVRRILVEKRQGFDLEARALKKRFNRKFTHRYYRKYKNFK